jgi:hypothetical protein
LRIVDFDPVPDVARVLDAPRERAEGALGVVFRAILRSAPADLDRALGAAVPEAALWMARAEPAPARFVVGMPAAAPMVRGGVGGALARLGFDPDAARRLVPAVMRFLRARLGPENAERLSFAVPFLRRLGGAAR